MKTLAKVCYIKPPKSEASDKVSASSHVSFLPMEDMGIDVKYVQAKQTKPLSAVVGSYTYFADGDVLLAKITPCFENGKLGIADGLKNGIGFGSSEYFVFRPDATVSEEWIYYFLSRETFRVEGAARMSGAVGHKRVSKDFIENYPIPFPPLDEQKRIVAKLDEAFAGLAKAKENAEKNLQNARALFESTLDDVFARNSEDWAVKQLEDVCAIGDGNHSSNYPKKHELVAKGVPFIRATNLVGGEISNEDMRFLSPKKHSQLKKGHLKTGDILFTNRGEIGKMAIVDPSHDGSNLNSQVAWLRCNETLNNRFLFHFLNSGKIKAHLESAKNGAALQQFTIKQIKELKIPIPSKDQQTEIVLGLDGLSKETQRLTRLYEQKLEALDSLKKSILHEAFSGNL
jgi:type I restriction enzyme S subunit